MELLVTVIGIVLLCMAFFRGLDILIDKNEKTPTPDLKQTETFSDESDI